MYGNKQAYANSADPDQTACEQSDQGLYSLPGKSKMSTNNLDGNDKKLTIQKFKTLSGIATAI